MSLLPRLTPPHQPATTDGDPLAWMADGICKTVDPDLWFPDKGGSTREAKKVCATCPIMDMCREYAIDNDERFGIWGGMSERDRRRVRAERNAAAARQSVPTAA